MKFVLTALLPLTAFAQQPAAPGAGVLGKGATTKLGPFFSAAVEVRGADGKDTALAQRGILFRPAGGGESAWACFDTEKCSVTGAWDGVEWDKEHTNLATYKGIKTGAFIVRSGQQLRLPPAQSGRWLGLRISGANCVFSYESAGAERAVSFAVKDGAIVETASGAPGGANWPDAIHVAGRRAEDTASYVADAIPLPDDNPWNCWLRPTGIDFFPDGRLALCTLGGDVWVASGLDDSLASVAWRRFAGGLREPMGLRIVNGIIHVGCRDQITRLRDVNGDGEADAYDCVNMGRMLVPNFHAFAYDLQTDRAGNFYFATGGNQLAQDEPWHGPLFRVPKDGGELAPIARGFRAPNGITIGPDDSIYVAENQGHWIPSSKISRIREGGHYGYICDPKFVAQAKVPPSFDPPLLYIPHSWDGSSGGAVFAPDGEKWGPLAGRMIHTSFGSAAVFSIFEQRSGDRSQGALVKLPLAFESGVHRARFSPADGQLYVCGTKGWQSRGIRDGCVARIRHTGKPHHLPIGWRAEGETMEIDFATRLDPAAAADPENYAMQQWNYKWHAIYGSPEYSIENPKRTGRDTLEIASVALTRGGRTAVLRIPQLRPAMQFVVKANIKSATGAAMPIELAGTVHFLK